MQPGYPRDEVAEQPFGDGLDADQQAAQLRHGPGAYPVGQVRQHERRQIGAGHLLGRQQVQHRTGVNADGAGHDHQGPAEERGEHLVDGHVERR